MKKPPLVIESFTDLLELGRYVRSRGLPFSEVRLALTDLPDAERASKEALLNRLFFSCGCAEATALSLASLVAFGLWVTVFADGLAAFSWKDLLVGLVIFFLASGLGKWIGLQRSRIALEKEIRKLREQLSRKASQNDKSAQCAVS